MHKTGKQNYFMLWREKEMKNYQYSSSCRTANNGSGYGIYCDCICRGEEDTGVYLDTTCMMMEAEWPTQQGNERYLWRFAKLMQTEK